MPLRSVTLLISRQVGIARELDDGAMHVLRAKREEHRAGVFGGRCGARRSECDAADSRTTNASSSLRMSARWSAEPRSDMCADFAHGSRTSRTSRGTSSEPPRSAASASAVSVCCSPRTHPPETRRSVLMAAKSGALLNDSAAAVSRQPRLGIGCETSDRAARARPHIAASGVARGGELEVALPTARQVRIQITGADMKSTYEEEEEVVVVVVVVVTVVVGVEEEARDRQPCSSASTSSEAAASGAASARLGATKSTDDGSREPGVIGLAPRRLALRE